jgi:hypothetical protein
MRIRDPGWRQFGSGIRDGDSSDPGSGNWDRKKSDPVSTSRIRNTVKITAIHADADLTVWPFAVAV